MEKDTHRQRQDGLKRTKYAGWQRNQNSPNRKLEGYWAVKELYNPERSIQQAVPARGHQAV